MTPATLFLPALRRVKFPIPTASPQQAPLVDVAAFIRRDVVRLGAARSHSSSNPIDARKHKATPFITA
ncbi:hypothetical protein MRX96_009324 [Rhipicephalus microplus]